MTSLLYIVPPLVLDGPFNLFLVIIFSCQKLRIQCSAYPVKENEQYAEVSLDRTVQSTFLQSLPEEEKTHKPEMKQHIK